MVHGYTEVGCCNVKGNLQLHIFWAIMLIMAVSFPTVLICDVCHSFLFSFFCRLPIIRMLTGRVNACWFVQNACFVVSLF